jgi:hypothetical protein
MTRCEPFLAATALAMPRPGSAELAREAALMHRSGRDHPTNLDEADHHLLQQRMPTLVAVVLVIAIVALLAYLRMR